MKRTLRIALLLLGSFALPLSVYARDVLFARVVVKLRVPFTPEGQLSSSQVELQREAISVAQTTLLQRLANPPGSIVTNAKFPPYKSFRTIPFLAIEVTEPQFIQLFQEYSLVENVSYEAKYYLSLTRSVPLIGADRAVASGFRGEGQVIAVLDTGIDGQHPALAGKIVNEACFSGWTNEQSLCPNGQTTQFGPGAAVPCQRDDCTHGTHVAGIAAGNGGGVRGVAPGARLLALQVFSWSPADQAIRALEADLLGALEWVFLQNAVAPAAVNMSLGRGKYDSPSTCDNDPAFIGIRQMIENLRSVGIATVAAAGNGQQYSYGLASPACLTNVVSVGATTFNKQTNEQINDGGSDAVDTSYSYSAGWLTLLAPGTNIESSVPGGGVQSLTGTSMAAPHVAGAFALLREQDPTASVNELTQVLRETGLPRSDSRNQVVTPRLQVDSALGLLGIEYRVYVEKDGWLDWQANGRISGTTGKSKRVEAIQIRLRNAPVGTRVLYRAHVRKFFGQGGGWLPWVADGETAGTEGQNRRLEAVEIVLDNPPTGVGVQYRAHVANEGWLGYVWDGYTAGTTGEHRRAEAFQIRLGPAPLRRVRYEAHVKNKGWLGWVREGEVAGTVGVGLRMEAVRIELVDAPAGVGIRYQAHVSGKGWRDWVQNGAIAGTVGQGRAMEAIRIQLVGAPAGTNVRYRAHVRGKGWLSWVANGEVAGTTGENRRMEALQILIE